MRELALNGMDVARFNFSHGDHAEHKHRLEILESVREELGIPIASLLDTKGPEIRTGKLKDGKKVTLKEGDLYTPVSYTHLMPCERRRGSPSPGLPDPW